MLSDPNTREVSPRSAMSHHTVPPQRNTATSVWTRRLIILLTILAAIGLGILLLLVASYITTTILIFIVASLIAYAIMPVVEFCQRIMPRWLAIVLVYVLVLGLLGLILYFIIKTMVVQLSTLAQSIAVLLQTGKNGQDSPLVRILKDIGLSSSQITESGIATRCPVDRFCRYAGRRYYAHHYWCRKYPREYVAHPRN